MTSAQERFYWQLWAAVKVEQGWTRLPAAEANAKRHAIHVQALGTDKSHKKFNNADCDSVFATFRVLADPHDLTKGVDLVQQQAAAKGERRRILFRIQQLGSQSYIEEIMRDKFDTTRLADLDLRQLDQLRITLIERKRAANRRAAVDAVRVVQPPLDFSTDPAVVVYEMKPRQKFSPAPARETASNPY